MQPLPHARPLPLVQPAVARRAAAEAELERQMPPRDPRVQDEQDSLQRLPIRQPLATRVAKPPLLRRQQRLDQLPQLVRDNPRRDSHRHPCQLDDRCRRRSSSGNGSLHFGSSSKRDSEGQIGQNHPYFGCPVAHVRRLSGFGSSRSAVLLQSCPVIRQLWQALTELATRPRPC
jgi:hypothetical protein